MLDEVLEHLSPRGGEVMLDCTLGGAGHSFEIAKKLGNSGLLIGIDQDEMARDAAKQRLGELDESISPRILIKAANFATIDDVLSSIPVPGIDLTLFDLGVSSPQLDLLTRGFSYKEGTTLDMRMDTSNNSISAVDVLNGYSQDEIARILRVYGEEKFASKIASNIVERRKSHKITTSDELVEIIKEAIPAAQRRRGGHPAKRTFQALRIAVNDELAVLQEGLESAIRWLNVGGRICVISYHSLEDRIVKEIFRSLEDRCVCSKDMPICTCGKEPILKCRPRGAILPSEYEVEINPRARSAKMRVAIKVKN